MSSLPLFLRIYHAREEPSMEQSSPDTGVVTGSTLAYQLDAQEIVVSIGSPAWYAWLEQAHSFSFRNDEGTFTAYKARASNQRGGWYWYAYRHRHGHFFRFYLGASSRLTPERLRDTARRLVLRSETPGHVSSGSFAVLPEQSQPRERSLQQNSERLSAPSLHHSSEHTQIALLTTKFHIPRLPFHYIARPRLQDALGQAVESRLTLVSAPAGSGKTTLLAAWARTVTAPVAWLSLEKADDDPQRFLSYVLAALSHLDTPISERDVVPWRITQEQAWEEILTNLVNHLARLLIRDTVLILDDYHLITSEPIHALLQFLIEHAPEQLHLLIGTRSEPPLPLVRLRAHGQLRELGAEQLHFSSAEMKVFLRAMELNLSTEAQHALEQQTQGWVVGVHLLALALRGHANPTSLLQPLPSVHRFFLEYVSEEILAQQPAQIRSFLLSTSILKRLTGSLCEAVTGQPDGQARLADLYRSNLLLHMLDDTGTWYGYHPLFAESLRAHLQKQEPELVPELYRRASSWYEEQGWYEEACEYAFLAGDLPRAAALLAELVPHLIMQEKDIHMRQWLSQLSPELIVASSQLWFASIWTQCGGGDVAKIINQLEQQIEIHAQDAGTPWADLPSELALFQAWAALFQGDLPRTISLVQETLHAYPSSEGPLSHLIAVHQRIVLSTAYRASGDLGAAEQVLLETVRADEMGAGRFLNLRAQVSLAELYEFWGQLHKLDHLYHEMFLTLNQLGDSSFLFLALTQARYATLLYEWNRLKEAEIAAQQAMELVQRLNLPITHVSLFCLWVLVRIVRALGDDERARHLLERAERDLVQLQLPEDANLLCAVPAQSMAARLALACGQIEWAERWEKTRGLRFDDSLDPPLSSSTYADYVTLAHILLVRGRSQRSTTSFAQALILLDHLRHAIVGLGYHGWEREIQMLAALALQAQGKTKLALKTLGLLLTQAESEGYVRLFADEGQPMMHLLTQIAAYTSASPSYIHKLQEAVLLTRNTPLDVAHPAPRQPLLDPLSVREQEVLRLLADGLSNQSIAQQLVISLHTVKLHVKHILAKLSVTNRTQAVARARELHLL